jgi:Xaa-Pro aminopeptidase
MIAYHSSSLADQRVGQTFLVDMPRNGLAGKGVDIMSISPVEYERRYAAIRALMKDEAIDCLLVVGLPDDFNRGNIRYITGSGRGGCCIFPGEGTPVLLAGINQSRSPKLGRTVSALEMLDVIGTTDNVKQALAELSRFDKGGRIGIIGTGCITVPMYLAIKEKFGERVVDAVGIFERVREIKSPEEIEKTRTAASIADRVYLMLKQMVRPGLSEYEIYGAVKKTIYEAGCEYSFDLIDAAGSSMNMSFFPTGDRLEVGGTLFLEITPAYEGYYAQLPVTLPVDSYSRHVSDMVKAWIEADGAAGRILCPGTRVKDLYHVLVDSVKASGFISPYRPGHAIGLDALDFWSITADSEKILKPGMVIAVHPSVMLELGSDGCGMGYTYLVTDTGAERLSKINLANQLIGNRS